MEKSITRRSFLTFGTAAAATAATAGLWSHETAFAAEEVAAGGETLITYADGKITAPELEASVAEIEPIAEVADEKTYDVVVIGAGTSGVPAALAAFEQGATVAVLQKETIPVAQGMLAARVVKDQSTEVGIMEYVHEMHTLNDHRPDLDLLKVYADKSEEALVWYEGLLAEAGFDECNESDSKDHVYEDGNCYVMGLLFPGSMVAPTTALANLAAEKGVEFFFETPAVQLVNDGEAVTGVIGKQADGSYVKFNATKGVILATGDYQNNDAMVERYVVDAQPFGRKQANKTGDGHLIGLMAGAVMEPGCHAKMIHGGKGCFREEPFLAVNLNGERFMYEDVAYGARNTILRDQPGNQMYSIFDDNYTDQVYSWGSDPTVRTVANGKPEQIAGFVEDGTLLAADTLEELAEAAGLPVDTFVATVERYNELCEQGADLDFGKAAKYMQPLTTPPFYAMLRNYQIAAIPAGLVIDANGQCLNANNEPIPGLFAAGNCSGPFYSATDYSLSTMGLSVGRCLTFGYVTGQYVATI